MSRRIKAAALPEFDAAHYLDSETSIAANLWPNSASRRWPRSGVLSFRIEPWLDDALPRRAMSNPELAD